MTPYLAVRKMSVEREKNGARFSLHVPHLDVCPGQTLAILGQSGCGKSTLLDLLALVLRPTRAEEFTLFPGTNSSLDLAQAEPAVLASVRAGEIGYVLQSGGLLSFLNVRENILLPGKLSGLPRNALTRRLDFLGKRLGIADQLDKKPQHLSGGQRQRAAIARALVHAPKLIFADEPTAAVDQVTASEIFETFQDIVKEMHTALVVVSHDVALARRFADRVATFTIERRHNSVTSTLVESEWRRAA